MSLNLSVYFGSIVKATIEYHVPCVEFLGIDYLPCFDLYCIALRFKKLNFTIWPKYDRHELNNPCPYDAVMPLVNDLKNYLNPLWC